MEKLELVPVRDFVLVKKEEVAPKSPGGLFMPVSMDEKITTAPVVKVGSGQVTTAGIHVPLEIQVGQKVVFNTSMGIEYAFEGQKYFLVREENIIAVVK